MKKITLLFYLFSIAISLNAQVTITETGFTAAGFEFNQMYTDNEVTGTLTSIDIDATLAASTNLTYANDLCIFITTDSDINSAGILQAGGFSDLTAAEKISWANGNSEVIGTMISDSQVLGTPIDFTANPTYNIWLGNGYGDGTASGTWDDINIVLNGVSQALSLNDYRIDSFSIYPNPTSDFISISNTDNSLEINNVGITDINGRAIKTIILGKASNNPQINVSDLSTGIYMLMINSNKGTGVMKFIKK